MKPDMNRRFHGSKILKQEPNSQNLVSISVHTGSGFDGSGSGFKRSSSPAKPARGQDYMHLCLRLKRCYLPCGPILSPSTNVVKSKPLALITNLKSAF